MVLRTRLKQRYPPQVRSRTLVTILFVVAALATRAATAAELSGEISFEDRLFPSDALDGRQQDAGLSIALEPELFHDRADGN